MTFLVFPLPFEFISETYFWKVTMVGLFRSK